MISPKLKKIFVKYAQSVCFVLKMQIDKVLISNKLEAFHRQTNSLFCNVDGFDLYLDLIAD